MFEIGSELRDALANAAQARTMAAKETARSGSVNAALPEGAMASFAARALFSEALMSALHARLAEIKSVTK